MLFGGNPALAARPSLAQDKLLQSQRQPARPLLPTGAFGQGAPVLEAQQAPEGHWQVGGFDDMRTQPPPTPQALPQAGPLGASMRQPFDYEKAKATLAGDQEGLSKLQKIALVLSAGLQAGSGNQRGANLAMHMLMQNKQGMADRRQRAAETVFGWQHDAYQNQQEADLRASNPYTVGRSRLQYNPATGQTQELYRGPQDFELYAQQLGLEPGSPDYFQAVEDYVLRSSGPSAHDRDMELDDHRTGNDMDLENLRYGNRQGMERLRQSNRRGMVDYRNASQPPRRSRSRSGGSPSDAKRTYSTPQEAARNVAVGETFQTSDGRTVTMTADLKRKYGG